MKSKGVNIFLNKQKLSGSLEKRRMVVETRIMDWYPNLEILDHYAGASFKMKFRCKRCGDVFYRRPSSMMYDCNRTKYGCPKCNIGVRVKNLTISLDEALNRIHSRFPNIEYVGGYRNYHDSAVFKCLDCGHTFKRAPVNFEASRSGCPYCTRKIWGNYHRLDPKQYEKQFNDKFPNLTLLTKYVNGRTDIKVKCDICGHIWLTNPTSLLTRKLGCQVCANRRSGLNGRKSQQQFWNDLKIVNPNVVVLEKYEGNKVPIKVKCTVCGYTWKARPNDLLTSRGRCSKCGDAKHAYSRLIFCKKYQKIRAKNRDESYQHYIQSAFAYYFYLKHPHARLLTLFKGQHQQVKVKCLECGNTRWVDAVGLLIAPACISCERTNISIGEQKIIDLLSQAHIHYQYPYIPANLVDKYPLHYDFRVKGKYLIEFQGEQHYRPVDRYGGVKQFNIQQEHDQMKRQWAKDNGFILIEIKFNESIKQKLSQYFPEVSNYDFRAAFLPVRHQQNNRYNSAVRLNAQLIRELDELNSKCPFSQFMCSLILEVDNRHLDLIEPKYKRAESRSDVVVKTTLLSEPAYKVFKSYRSQFDSGSAELRAFLHTYYLYRMNLEEAQGG